MLKRVKNQKRGASFTGTNNEAGVLVVPLVLGIAGSNFPWNLSQIFIGSKIIQIFRELIEQDRREAERASATNIVGRAERG